MFLAAPIVTPILPVTEGLLSINVCKYSEKKININTPPSFDAAFCWSILLEHGNSFPDQSF
jgi:hypothetical protein